LGDIVLVYDEYGKATEVKDPAWLEVAAQLVVAVVTSIVKGLGEAAVQAGRDLLEMLTVERLTASLTNYAREQAGTWVTKTILDAGHQEWLGTALHAFGLDMEDLLTISNNALDRGFTVMTTELSAAFRESGMTEEGVSNSFGPLFLGISDGLGGHLGNVSSAIGSTLQENAQMQTNALGQWSLYETQNYNSQEEINRMNISAIFTDTEERVRARSQYSSEEQVAAMRRSAEEELSAHLPGVMRTLGDKIRPFQNWLNEITLTARDSFFYLLVPGLPVSYEHVGVTALSAFGAAVGMGLTAHAVATAADLLHPIKQTGLPQIAAFIADMAGFGAIAKATWYTDLTHFLSIPYKHYSLKYFRPTLPDAMTLQMMAVKPDIRMEDFRRGMEYWGFNNSWIDAIQRTMYKEPRYFELSMLMEDANASPAWLYKKFRRQGYVEADAEIAVGGMMSKVLRPYLQEYRIALQYLYTEGYLTEEQFDAQLGPLLLRSEAHSLLKKAARFRYLKAYTDDSVSMFTDMYVKDLIDDEDFSVSLAGLGIAPEKRNLLVTKQVIKKQAKIAKEERADIKKQIRQQQAIMQDIYIASYRSGNIDENTLYSALVFAGISAEIATLTVELEKQKRIMTETKKAVYTVESEQESIRKKYESGYITLYRNDIIDEDTLTAYLKGLDLEDDYVAAVVETEYYKKLRPEAVDVG
jgi:hypothetical protein